MNSRTKNTKRNIIASGVLMITQMAFQLLSRSIIVYALGSDYLGLSSLYTSILQVLNIAESGFSVSVVYFMYRPIAEGNTDEVCALMNYLRKVYKIVGTIIFSCGLLCMPFIPLIIKGNVPSGINVYVLYVLYLVNSGISYFFFAYKTSMLTAIQRLDLTKIASTVVIFVQYGLQLLALLVFHNYYLYVVALILGTCFVNLFTAYICKKHFPEYECRGELSKEKRKEIIIKVKGLLICNISGVTYTALDSIVISACIGLFSVAIYNNYITIFSTVTSIVLMIRTSMQASVGNSIASETIDKNYDDMKLWQFLFSVIATWCTSCLICLYQPCMTIWMGKEMLLPMIDVVLIGVWFMISVVQHAHFLYLAGTGLWNEMKGPYIFSTVFNLIMNIALGKLLGITGIILASLLATMISGSFWQCIILFKNYYKMSAKNYLINQIRYFGIAFVIIALSYILCHFITCGGILELIIKAVICVVVTSVLLVVLYYKNPYIQRSKKLLLSVIGKRN